MPVAFWFSVTREVLLAALFATMICATLLNLGGTTLVRLFIGYVVVYVAMLVVALCRLRGRSNSPLERTGSAGRSACALSADAAQLTGPESWERIKDRGNE